MNLFLSNKEYKQDKGDMRYKNLNAIKNTTQNL